MGEQGPKMSKRFFGYDPMAVESMLAERDAMLTMAERRVQAAEARSAQMEGRLRALEEQAAAPPASEQAPEPVVSETNGHGSPATDRRGFQDTVPEELTKVVNAAEASASQIIEAWTATREQILQADRLWRDVQDEVVRFAAWRDDVEPIMEQIQYFIEMARTRIEEVPGRVESALTPVVEAMSAVSDGMSRFAAFTTMPLLSAPPRRQFAPAEIETAALDAAAPGEETAVPALAAREETDPSAPADSAAPPPQPFPFVHGWLEDGAGDMEGQLDDLADAAVSQGQPETAVPSAPPDIFEN